MPPQVRAANLAALIQSKHLVERSTQKQIRDKRMKAALKARTHVNEVTGLECVSKSDAALILTEVCRRRIGGEKGVNKTNEMNELQ